MTGVDTIHAAFQDLRADTDPRGHELLAALEELCVEAVDMSRTIAAHVASLQHERRVAQTIERIQQYGSAEHHEQPPQVYESDTTYRTWRERRRQGLRSVS